jgi:hypothetical protein
MAAVWPVEIISSGFSGEPCEHDPYGLFSEGEEEKKQPGVIPYNPAILQKIQDSGKF